MQRSFFIKAATVAAGAFVTLSAATANAQFANTLNVAGQLRFSASSTGALLIDFLSGGSFPPGTVGNGTPGNVFAGATTGAFTSIAPGANGTIQDLTSTGGAATTTNPAGNAASFMTIGGYTFSLGSAPAGTSTGPLTITDQSGGAIASFSTFGIVSGSGFPTPLTYQGLFTAQFVGLTAAQVLTQVRSTGGTPVVTFSANFGAPVGGTAVVPEPSTYALLATGMGALGLVTRRRRTQA